MQWSVLGFFSFSKFGRKKQSPEEDGIRTLKAFWFLILLVLLQRSWKHYHTIAWNPVLCWQPLLCSGILHSWHTAPGSTSGSRLKVRPYKTSLTQFFLFLKEIICLTKEKTLIVGWNNFVIWITFFFTFREKRFHKDLYHTKNMDKHSSWQLDWHGAVLWYVKSIRCNTQSTTI